MNKPPSRQPGPNSPIGKANSSKNSTKHSLCANPAQLFPGETQEDYNAIRDIWFAEYDSDSPGTERLLEPLINSDRQVRYSTNAVMKAEIALHNAETAPERNDARIESIQKDVTLKLRYKTQHERSFQRALRNIEQFGQRRDREELAGRRLYIYQLKTITQTALLCKTNGIDAELVILAANSPSDEAQPDPQTEPEGAENDQKRQDRKG